MANILLLEPDTVMARQYVAALSSAGHACFWSASAQKALAVLDDESIDAVLMELQLGQHNGLEFLYEIRTYGDLRNLPVVIISSVDPALVQNASTYGLLRISEYLYKPTVKLTQIVTAIDDALPASVRSNVS
ncbi:hypothetical protein BH23PAT2_BH23PAT2_01870 [soil metagenome]